MSGEWSDEARRKRLELRAMLAGKDLIVMPGGFSPVYARMAQEIGKHEVEAWRRALPPGTARA